ncbi:hypothetical protein EC988_006888, partial [Linderina pennispora]
IIESVLYGHFIRWDDKDRVVITDFRALLTELQSRGMAASQVDSLQKNFNDYKFKRITDQRRLRHINEKRTVIFEHEFFKPGRPDLLERIVRKSAELKAKRMRLAERESQQQSQIASNYGHHQSLPPPLPHRNRVRSEDSNSVFS